MNLLFAKLATMMLDAPKIDEDSTFGWVNKVTAAINAIMWPILIVVAAAGTIYAIVLGVNMARADSTEKREEAKKRVINVLVGMAIMVGLLLLFWLLVNQILPAIVNPDGSVNGDAI